METDRVARIKKCIAMLALARDKEVQPGLAEVWELVLEGVDIALIEKACLDEARSPSAFMPTPGQLLERCTGGVDSRTEDAWHHVVQRIRRGWEYGQSPPDVEYAVRCMGGWEALAMTDSEEFHAWKRKRFGEVYGVSLQKEAVGQLPDPARIRGVIDRGGPPGQEWALRELGPGQ